MPVEPATVHMLALPWSSVTALRKGTVAFGQVIPLGLFGLQPQNHYSYHGYIKGYRRNEGVPLGFFLPVTSEPLGMNEHHSRC